MNDTATETVEVVETSGELQLVESSPRTLFRTNDPTVALARMVEISNVIVDVIERQRFYVTIGGKKYVTCPGWKTAGGMLGLSPYTAWTKPNETGDGYLARVEIRTLDERTIAAAEAECSRDEPIWKKRPKHALRSMAETRATSRAFRGPLEQVFALGGYEGTAAEEMSADTDTVEAEPDRASRHAAAIRPTREQGARLRELLAQLAERDPDRDWPTVVVEVVGVPFDKWTPAVCDMAIESLEKVLAQREAA
jgi:hypothetical protein